MVVRVPHVRGPTVCLSRSRGVGRGRRPRRPARTYRPWCRPTASSPRVRAGGRGRPPLPCAWPCTPRLYGVGRGRRPRRPVRTYRPTVSPPCGRIVHPWPIGVVPALRWWWALWALCPLCRYPVCATLNRMDDLPVRKRLNHHAPYYLPGTFFFVTICARARGVMDFVENAAMILEAVRHYHVTGKWFVTLCLVMPDHLHMLVHVSNEKMGQSDVVGGGEPRPSTGVCGLSRTIGDFKSFLSKTGHLCFQRGFFDTRIRDEAHYAEKWAYIVRNPVARGLSATPRAWPHVIAFSRQTGEEIPHR